MIETETTLQRLNRINPNFDFPDWCFERVISETEIPNFEYWKSLPTFEKENYPIELIKIKGTRHSSYQCLNWIRMLAGLNRCFSSYNFESCHEFFREKEYNKSGFSFDNYGDIFIITGGNNRTCIDKFIGIKMFYGIVTEHFFDSELFELHSSFLKHEFDIKHESIRRDAKITFNILGLEINIENFQLKKDFLAFYEDINQNFIYSFKVRLLLQKRLIFKSKAGRMDIKNIENLNDIYIELYAFKFLSKLK